MKGTFTRLLGLSCLLLAGTDCIAQKVVKGPSSSKLPYQLPYDTSSNVRITSILTVGDAVNGYKMAGIPDGLGAFDNGDGTFTVVMNHEHGNTSGNTRAHGSKGAFISKWIINKSDLRVISGADLMQKLHLWDVPTTSYITYYTAVPFANGLNRFCSADLPAVSAFYNAASGKGTKSRIFMNGEENGDAGRAIAHVVTGPEAGNSYEVPYLGKAGWENYVACPRSSDSTIVIGMDDQTPGQVYVYIGTKKTTGTEIEKAGLTGGKLYGVAVSNILLETNATRIKDSNFTLVDLGQVQNMTGAAIQTASSNGGVTQFLRPEDGAWDPMNPTDFYFLTTNNTTDSSRMYRLRFTDANDFTKGGKITAMLTGSEGQKMMDNLGIDHWGNVLIQEDMGGNIHLGKTWQYNLNDASFKRVLTHDSLLFLPGKPNFITQDEEASGMIDVQEILGPGWFLSSDQIHASAPGELVEQGQFVAIFNPDSYNANPEVKLEGNSNEIPNGSANPSTGNNTDFGNVIRTKKLTKTFTLSNGGPAALKVSGISISGANANEFTIIGAPTFPLNIAAAGSQTITIEFAPTALGLRKANLNIASNDFDESSYTVALQGVGLDNTGVAMLPDGSSLKLFPNPTRDEVTVSVTLKNADNIGVMILDINGREMMALAPRNYDAGEQKIIMNTSMLPNGTYYVQVSAGNAITRTKLVVMH